MAALAAALLSLAACGGGDDGGEPAAAGSPEEPAPDTSPAPTLEFERFDGTTASLQDYEGSPTVVNFWASWCPPCVDEMPGFETVNQEFPGVEFVGINTQDEPEAARELADETGVTYDLARDPDGELFRAFEVVGMPSTFFLSEDGAIVGEHTGALTEDSLRTRIRELFAP